MANELTGSQALKKAKELISQMDICMLTTTGSDGGLHSRPMSTNGEVDSDGTIWFFSTADTLKIEEISSNPRVNASFASKSDGAYLSFSGTAEVVRDIKKAEQLWRPELKAWFPDGVTQSNLILIKIVPNKIEYWDTAGSLISHTLGLGKALLTGSTYEPGEHGKVG